MAGDDADRADDGAGSDGLEAAVGRRILPSAVRRRYAAKFFLSLFLVLVVIGGLGAVTYVEIQTIIETDAKDTLRSTATLQADSISEWMAGMRVQTRSIAYGDAFASGDEERIRTYLASTHAAGGGDVKALYYVDPAADEIVASTDPAFEGRPPSAVSPALEGPVAAAAQDPGPVHTSETAYENQGNLSIVFATAVRGADGVLVLDGDVASDFEQLHETRSIVTTRLLAADGKGVLSPRRNNPSDLSDTAEFERALAGETTTVERADRVVALSPVPNSSWVVTTTAPRSELYRASDTVGRNVIVLVATSLLVLGIVGVVLGRQTVVPLVRLRERAQQMEDGNLDVDLRTDREDEIGRLFDSFANMRDALREQIEAAERARREAEASRRDLARQNERLDQFASTVSHDLRNPLTVARGNLELLATRVDDLDDDGADDSRSPAELLERIDRAHARIDAIVDDVLALARGGELVRETTATDLASVAREAWDNVETDDATLSVRDTRQVDADRDRLLRALENLFRNAVEHGSTSPGSASPHQDAVEHGSTSPASQAQRDAVEPGSTSPGSASPHQDAAEHAGPAVAVEVGLTDDGFYVADDGPGIPAAEADAVFAYGHTNSQSGTGLGLSIVRTIAQAHGWDVTVDTSFENGAKFVFTDVFDE